MKLTNETGLPAPVVAVAQRLVNEHPVFKNDTYSVTELLKSEQQIVLSRRHAEDIEMDVQDTYNLWSGTAIHNLLSENTQGEGLESEKRFKIELEPGLFLSGGYDLYDKNNNVLYDYKNTKVATYNENKTGREQKWIKQLYLYALGIERTYGKRPSSAVLVAFLKDHSKIQAQTKESYPKHPIEIIQWLLDDDELSREAIGETTDKARRVKEIMKSGEQPAPCTYEDCWCTEDWAIKKSPESKALKVFDNPNEAYSYWCKIKDKGYRIYHRVSDYKNCRDYCTVSKFCPQWQECKNHEAICEDVTEQLDCVF